MALIQSNHGNVAKAVKSLIMLISCGLAMTRTCQGFGLTHVKTVNRCTYAAPTPRGAVICAGLFGSGGLFGKNEEMPQSNDEPKRLFEIPVESLKSGGLRFALGLHLIGQQGNPEKGSWKANQASDSVLDMYYKDDTGKFSITLTDKAIYFDRYGVRPSLQYVLQESVLLHGVLDELNTLAFGGDEDIEDENRLLRLAEPGDAIEKARETLPARAA